MSIAVTDNAANEQKAYELLEWTRFGCYGHRINLVVKNALKIPDVVRILGKIQKLVTFFHQSTSMADLLFDKQKLLMEEGSIIGHKLIMDVVTRWNSTLHMLKRILEQIPAVSAVANDPTITKSASSTLRNCLLTFDKQAVVEDLVTVLDPFDKTTTIVCGENIPTLQKILPLVVKLTRLSEEGDYDSPTIKRVTQQIQNEMGNRTEPERIALVACILNPYTKDLTF
ncbi:zinc finger BED domain-containing protein 4-like [Saccostrea cucullata]|uniref:zinc finger BED domain-containing protein 4-like n=1 Tax=Saccostrea cuccullata TaxID=36930 RepID=UPI002ED3A143